MSNPIPLHQNSPQYLTYAAGDEEAKAKVWAGAGRVYDQLVSNDHPAMASVGRAGIRARDNNSREDYDWFRPGEAIPTRDEDIISACMQASDRFAIAKNLIDMMSEFVNKGISVIHPSPRIEQFGKVWAKKVGLYERSERLASMLLRAGVAPVQRLTWRLPDTTMDVLRSSNIAVGVQVKSPVKLPDGEIPMGYSILDPRAIRPVGKGLANFVGKPLGFGMLVSSELQRQIRHPQGLEKELVDSLPDYIRKAVMRGDKVVPLDPVKTRMVYYKKDDHQVWPKPMLYPLLDAFSMYNKLKAADRSALDGVISNIRFWRLGSLDHRIFPNKAAFDRLINALSQVSNGQSLDFVWGPELELFQSSSESYKFLGMEKYIPTLQEIFLGLGIPPSLNGIGESRGFTNSVVALRTLIERLTFLRNVVMEFWLGELLIVQAQMGFRQSFQLTFDETSFTDETAFYKLLIELADRDLVSAEYVQEQFGAVPGIEKNRLKRERKMRENGQLPPKAGPYHYDSVQRNHLERMYVQHGVLAPSEVGLEVKNKTPGDQAPVEKLSKLRKQENKLRDGGSRVGVDNPKHEGENGRPLASKDVGKRKTRTVKPQARAELRVWAEQTQKAVASLCREAYLTSAGKKNLRSLSSEQRETFERFCFAMACQYQPGEEVTEESIQSHLEQGTLMVPLEVRESYTQMHQEFLVNQGREPSREEQRQLRALVLADWRQSGVSA